MAESPTATEDDLERPKFRGCVVCYSVEMVAYGVRRARR